MSVAAQDLEVLGVVDRIVAEPLGGAHRDPNAAIDSLGDAIIEEVDATMRLSGEELVAQRRKKFLAIGS